MIKSLSHCGNQTTSSVPLEHAYGLAYTSHVQKSYGRTENRTAVLKTKNKPRKQSTFFFSTFTNKIGACARNRTRVRFFLRPYGFRTSCTVYVHFVRCSSTCVRQPIRMFKRNGGSSLQIL